MQCTVSNEKTSKTLSITVRVPQGSAVGLFLFLVYINNLHDSCNSDIMLCANDAVFLCNDKTSSGLKHKSETKMQKIKNWAVANKLKIILTKTNYIIFSNQQKPTNTKKFAFVLLMEQLLNKSFKYLPVTVDNKLSWEQHTQSVVKKLSTARGIIRKLSLYAPFYILINVYLSASLS